MIGNAIAGLIANLNVEENESVSDDESGNWIGITVTENVVASRPWKWLRAIPRVLRKRRPPRNRPSPLARRMAEDVAEEPLHARGESISVRYFASWKLKIRL